MPSSRKPSRRKPPDEQGTASSTTGGGVTSGVTPIHVETRDSRHEFTVEEAVRQEMARSCKLDGPISDYEYKGGVPASRPTGDYTPRLLPHNPDARVPLEANEIPWQR